MVLVQKWPVLPTFLFSQYGPGKCLYDILKQKMAFLGYKNDKFKKSKNWHFSKRVNPWLWSKSGHFCQLFFLDNIGQENVFHDNLEQKNTFLGFNDKKFKKQKKGNFFKRVILWFWSENGQFCQLFPLVNMGQENAFTIF